MNTTNSIIALRETDTPNYTSRIYVRYGNLEKPVHISSLYGSALREVIIQGGNVEYLLDVSKIRELDIYEVVRSHEVLHVNRYQLVDGCLKQLDRHCTIAEASTGNEKLDELVSEVVKYRAFWSTKLCKTSKNTLKAYDAVLKARVALSYYLFKRLKEAWTAYSNEYLGFAYVLVHSVLGERGFVPVKAQLEEICDFAKHVDEPRWKKMVVNYINNGLNVSISLERRLGRVVPDLLIATPRGNIVIECKQGPPATWLNKAVKQAKGYKSLISAVLVLLTSRNLSLHEREGLLKHYDYVVDGCVVENYDVCKSKLVQIL